MKKKILIVGGSGFIGHNLAIYLKENNFEPYIVDSLGVNNILSVMDDTVKDKKLYSSILNKRIELIQKNNINRKIRNVLKILFFSSFGLSLLYSVIKQ